MSDTPSPFTEVACFICGAPTRTLRRYPHIACNDCGQRAVNRGGDLLEFFNTGIGGGFVAHLPDGTVDQEVTMSHVAYIDGTAVYVDEARFGGIVIQLIDVLHKIRSTRPPAPPS